MAEDLSIAAGNKQEQYESLIPQIRALIDGEPDLVANLGNIAAALKEQFGWLWVGFYLVKKDELVLGPFQGPVACTRIRRGRGVCGSSWAEAKTLIVPDVELFPGHIACSSLSRSEIVVPVIRNGEVLGVLDVDSEAVGLFDETDQRYLEEIVHAIDFTGTAFLKTVRISVTGKVQGVFYRKSAKDKAIELGIKGWVRNEDDGSVTIEATGEPAALAALAEWCHEGSPRAVVTNVQVEDIPFHDFPHFISER